MIDIEKIVRPNILELMPYSSARDEYTEEKGIFLDANENPFGKLNRYPDPYQRKLKEKLADLKKVSSDTIFIGNGSDEIIDLAFRIFCVPGVDKALTFSPTYGMYAVSAAINNVELLEVPLNQNFQIDSEQVKPYLVDKKIKLIFICSPNNPTGNLMRKKDIEFLVKNFKGIILIDEAYIDFSKEESLIELIDTYTNLIISQTFSKAWGLAAARVGVAYANSKIIEFYNKVKPPYNVSELNQKAAIEALKNFIEYKAQVKLILAEKEGLKKHLESLDIVKKIYPSDANFLLIKVVDADAIYKQLVDQKISVRNRDSIVANCIRISIGTPKENKKLLQALKNIII